MRRLSFVAVVAAVAACGNSVEPTWNGTSAKGEEGAADYEHYSKPKPVKWTTGKSAGAYVRAWTERLAGGFVYDMGYRKEIPTPNYSQRPEWFYSIEATPRPAIPGHLGFYVAPETRPVRLAADSFILQVDVEIDEGAAPENYDLALLKFYNIDDYAKVVVRLDEAIAGRIITPTDHAPGKDAKGQSIEMIDALQSALDKPDRIGVEGTWKVIAVPRNRKYGADIQLWGAPEVKISHVWLLAAPSPAPAATPLPAGFEAVNRQVIDALANRQYDVVQSFVDPDCGVFELYASGAMTPVKNYAQVSDEMNAMRYGTFEGASCQLQNTSELPFFSCFAVDWYKSGCYATNIVGYNSLTVYQKQLDRYGYDRPSSQETLDRLARCDAAVSVAVTSTDGNFTLSYGQIDGQWRLLVVDIIDPCGD